MCLVDTKAVTSLTDEMQDCNSTAHWKSRYLFSSTSSHFAGILSKLYPVVLFLAIYKSVTNYLLYKICENNGFHWSLLSRIRREYGSVKTRISHVFYAVIDKNIFKYSERYLGSYQTSMIEVHYKNYYRIKPVNCFHKGSPSQMFDWVLNTPLPPKNNMLDLIMACFTTLHQTPYKFLKWLYCCFDKNCTKNEVFHEGFLQ